MLPEQDDTAISKFWDKYIFILHSNNIVPPVDRWYVVRLEEYINFFKQQEPTKRLRQHNAKDIEKFIEYINQKNCLDTFKFYQLIHALQILFANYLNLSWAQECDWDYWKAAKHDSASCHLQLSRQPESFQAMDLTIKNSSALLAQHQQLFEKLTAVIRQRNYSIRTEECYNQWAVRYILFHDGKAPENMNQAHIVSFLEYLAVKRNVSPSTQNQALCALVFLYTNVLGITLEKFENFSRAKKQPRLPVVMTQEETRDVLSKMKGVHYLMAALLYGTGMRLMKLILKTIRPWLFADLNKQLFKSSLKI